MYCAKVVDEKKGKDMRTHTAKDCLNGVQRVSREVGWTHEHVRVHEEGGIRTERDRIRLRVGRRGVGNSVPLQQRNATACTCTKIPNEKSKEEGGAASSVGDTFQLRPGY